MLPPEVSGRAIVTFQGIASLIRPLLSAPPPSGAAIIVQLTPPSPLSPLLEGLLLSVKATSSPASPPFGEFPPLPSDSKSISGGQTPPRCPTRNTRRRRWGT